MLKELSNSAVGERDVLVDAYLNFNALGFDIGSKNASPLPSTEPKLRPEHTRQSPMTGKRE